MMKTIGCLLLLLAVATTTAGDPDEQQQIADELDAYWSELARTVAEGDFDAYARGYHEDAVYVSLAKGESFPISGALENWRQGFIDTREGKTRPTVQFRFSRRLHDATTAHETGIFRYGSVSGQGEASVQFIHFEALLVKRGRWLTMMELQKSAASEEEWAALASGPATPGRSLSNP